jgi:hypothetical protein
MSAPRRDVSEKPPDLSVAHYTALSARMYIFEEDCQEIDRALDGYHGISRDVVGEVAERQKKRIRAVLAEILECLASLKLDLGLRKQEVDIQKVINARLSRMWVTLHESKSQYLRGYGAVPEELKSYLDPRIDELLSLWKHLREILSEGTAEEATK